MVGPLDAINGVAAIINLGISYAQNNAWAILLLLAVGYVVKTKAVDPYLESRHYRPEAAREADYKDELRRIRMKQQEETNLRAIEAAKERNEIKEKEKTRKNQIFDPKKQTIGTKLGRGNDYSPMQPWSGSTGSGRYKPAKRTVKRG